MGLIGWIKKEIESNSRQRRLSAPPISLYNENNVNQHRDEAYMKAVRSFNEWRNNQRFEKLNETKNASAITNAEVLEESIITTTDFSISDLEIEDSEKRRLIEIRREQRKVKQNVRKVEHKVDFYMTQSQQRFSLPILKETSSEHNSRRKSKRTKIHPSNTIDEIEEFETNHCHKMDEDFSLSVTSPPSKFYRENSEPYSEPKKKMTPKKLMGRNMLRRNKSHGKGRAPQPPIDSESSSGFRNGNFKHYDVVSSSAYDEFVKQSNIYKMNNNRREDPEKINSVGETASSGSSTCEIDKKAKKDRRMSPPYLTVINKHGEEVEYALPYSERESLVTIPPLPDTPAPANARIPPSQFDQIINENFNFLQSHLDFVVVDEDKKMRNSEIFDPIYNSFTEQQSVTKARVQITDLDKSNDTSLLKTPAQSSDIIKELEALSKWTKNLKNCEERTGDQKCKIEEYLKIDGKVRVFRSQDIKIKSGILRNSLTSPLELSYGFFHKTPITLRSTLPDVYNDNCIAEVASKRDYEILSQVRHQNVAALMGISYDYDLRAMSLVIEPFEFTLNHYIHQMDQYFSIQQTISIASQIAYAVQYLHESGFIHSNINSHAILVRQSPFCVKLSSFELTTEILPRESIERIYRQRNIKDGERSLMRIMPEEPVMVEKYYKLSKHHFYNESTAKEFPAANYEKESRLAYLIDFRRIFAPHFYQAPELLPPKNDVSYKFVLPTIRSDIFSLGLLLWETLNHCIPFVIYNYDELSSIYDRNEVNLPLLDKSCIAFMDIFNNCLHRNADERLSDVHQFIEMLNVVDVAIEGGEKVSFKNIKEKKKFYEKLPEKIYFKSNQKSPQKRAENAITFENIQNLKPTKSFSESIKSSELEAHVVSFSNQPEILQDDTINRIRKSLENQHVVAPKKPQRSKDEIGETLEMSKRSDSTMFHSFFELNRLTTPKIDKNGVYERTSTLKKRLKGSEVNKKSVRGLFDSNFDKMNFELGQIAKTDFMDEIKQEMNEKNRHEVNSFLNKGMTNDSRDVSRSTDDMRKTLEISKIPNIKRSESTDVTSNDYHFEIEDYKLPNTPIARQNKIRRNAWLSESKKPSGGKISENENFKPNKSSSDVAGVKRNFNVSIKIHRNDLDKNVDEDSSSHLTKINNSEMNSSKYNVDINKKYYPMMPEMLSDVIQNKREKSMSMSICDGDKIDGQIMPVRSVREAVKYIESTYIPQGTCASQRRTTQIFDALPRLTHEETQTEKFFIPQLRKTSFQIHEKDEANECMTKASQSIQKLSEIITNGTENFPQIRQAQVTVNVKQITHRASDIGQLKKFQDQNRHSVCNSAELIKRLQMHFKTSQSQKSLNNVSKNDIVSASCSNLIAKTNELSSQQLPNGAGKCCKYFCRNCGFTMLPVEFIQKIQGSGRVSLASSIAESLQSIKGQLEEGSQSTVMRRCPPITETRSTEDIYIDDDFCQGISQSLAANMELLPPPDFFDSLDFNFFELLQSQQHDWTLRGDDEQHKNQLEWNGSDNEEEKEEEEKLKVDDDVNDNQEVK